MTRTPPPSGSSPAAIIETIAAALRRERERAGLTLTELARRAGLAKSTLSQLESGTGNPSVETLWALGVALGVPFSRLVAGPADAVQVVRAGGGTRLHSESTVFIATLLSAGARHVRRDLYTIELGPGAVRHAEAHTTGSREHVVVAAGRLRAGPVDTPVELAPGDYATFAGDVPHLYEALAPATWAVLIMEHP